ncbi:Hypothetical_protein [Hexamita inflata]|uniref:Hypothetical_protein n=1 Tax=Hexamita inflata TaxID=28002 RepID=A0AA86QL24_9EUKA|nr:Hypothetical protein HINF_LOCUS46137 [Hexamita inflata]
MIVLIDYCDYIFCRKEYLRRSNSNQTNTPGKSSRKDGCVAGAVMSFYQYDLNLSESSANISPHNYRFTHIYASTISLKELTVILSHLSGTFDSALDCKRIMLKTKQNTLVVNTNTRHTWSLLQNNSQIRGHYHNQVRPDCKIFCD